MSVSFHLIENVADRQISVMIASFETAAAIPRIGESVRLAGDGTRSYQYTVVDVLHVYARDALRGVQVFITPKVTP